MGQRPRILLLDDDEFHRGLLAEGLEAYYDFEVTRVNDLAAAQQVIAETRPDLLLLDLVLGEDRFGVIQWVKGLRDDERFKALPVLFVTAYFREMEEHVRNLGETAILEKPFGFEDVVARIEKLMGQGK